MKLKYLFAIISTYIAISTPLYAQNNSYGIGSIISAGYSELYFPITLGRTIVEPTLYYQSQNVKQEDFKLRNSRYNAIGVGFGLFKKIIFSDVSSVYYGGRFKYTKINDNYKSLIAKQIKSTTRFMIIPTFGAEYFASDEFSMGIEIGLAYSQIKTSGSRDDTNIFNLNSKSSDIYTVGLVIFRYHFN